MFGFIVFIAVMLVASLLGAACGPDTNNKCHAFLYC